MTRKHIAILSLCISLLFISVIWQFAETEIHAIAEQSLAKITGRPFHQVSLEDAKGIPMQLYSSKEKHYNPLFIARDAKTEYLMRQDPAHAERFVLLTDWLLAHGVETDTTYYVNYDFDFPVYAQTEPWQSALAQSVLMNALALRASYERDLEIYTKAIKAFNTLMPTVSHLSVALSDSSYWYMEYPAPEPYYVLNGMIGVLLELDHYHSLTKDPLAQELFDKGYNALLLKLPSYDFWGYSRYDLSGMKAGRMYHQTHIKQLSRLQEIRPSQTLVYYRDRWHKADSYPVLWQMLLNPRPKRIIAFVLPFILLWAAIYFILAASHKTTQNDPEHS